MRIGPHIEATRGGSATTLPMLRLGRLYTIVGRDRYGLPYAEIGRSQRVVPLSNGDTAMISGSSFRATWGWSVRPTFETTSYTLNASLGRLWIEVFR